MRYYHILIFMLLASCKDINKLTCYSEKLKAIESVNVYHDVFTKARTKIPLMTGSKGRKLFRDSSYIDSAVIDDAIFFNSDRTKCLILVLQQTDKSLYVDQVRIIQSTKIGKDWSFLPDRMPDVPEIIFTVRKTGSRDAPKNNSFRYLSDEGRKFVLQAGTVKSDDCDIDEKYWFGAN